MKKKNDAGLNFLYFPQRRAEKEQQQFLKELEALTGGVEDDGEEDLALSVLPDYTSGCNVKARKIITLLLFESKLVRIAAIYGRVSVLTTTTPQLIMAVSLKDIHVRAFDLDIAGKTLLESTDLKLSFNRRYGFVGKNGVGKTTLLLRMASYDIAGFPRHHRVLHVKQEIKASQVVSDLLICWWSLPQPEMFC